MRSLFAVFSLSTAILLGQATQTGTVRGTILDPTGAVVPNANVAISNETRLVTRSIRSGADGVYLFQYLPPGTYELVVEAQGFSKVVNRNLLLRSGNNMRMDVPLQPSPVATTVEVTAAAAAAINTVNANINHTVGSQEFRDILLPTNDALRIAAFLPGARDEYRHNGRPDGQAVIVVDGENDGDENISAGTWKFHPPADAIAEFRVTQDNYTADMGRASGVRLEYVTKSGTNDVHGSLYGFHRNEKFNARNWGSTTKSQSRLHDLGYTAGGPIKKERIYFFFTSYYRRTNNPVSGFRTWPTHAQLKGDFSAWLNPGGGLRSRVLKDPVTNQPFPGNIIPSSRLNPNAAAYLNLFYPNVADPYALVNNDYTTGPDKRGDDYYAPRFDFRMTDKLNMYWRFTYDHKIERLQWVAPQKELKPDAHVREGRPISSTLAGTYLASPTFLVDFQVAFNRTSGPHSQRFPNAPLISNIPGWSSKLLFPEANRLKNLPHITLASGYTTVGRSTPWENKWAQGSTTVNFSLQGPKHNIRFGIEEVYRIKIQFQNQDTFGTFNFDGSVTSDSLADLLIGKARTFVQASQAGYWGMGAWQHGLYAQDEIRVNQKLTVTLGLRWESDAPYASVRGQKWSNWLPELYNRSAAHTINPQTGDIVGPVNNENGIKVVDVIAPSPKKNFAPRIGFAYAPWGTKTSFRAGYGFFYDHLPHPMTQLSRNPPFLLVTNVFDAALDDPNNGSPNLRPVSLTAVSLPYRTPRTQKYSAGVQRQISNMLLDVSYVGSFSTHQIVEPNINQPTPNAGVLARRVSIESVRPYYGFGSITYRQMAGLLRYNSLQASLKRPVAKGLFLQAAYTLSRLTRDGAATDPRNRAYDRGRSPDDIPQIFSLAASYTPQWFAGQPGWRKAVFFGWQLSSTVRLLSGQPLGVSMQTDTAGIGRTVLADWNGSVDQPRTMGRWFDPTAFSAPAPLTFGNSPADAIRGPGQRNWDLGLFRNFQITEKLGLQSRFEAYNFMNHFNLNNPSTSFGTPNFGRIINKSNPRNLQMGLRLNF